MVSHGSHVHFVKVIMEILVEGLFKNYINSFDGGKLFLTSNHLAIFYLHNISCHCHRDALFEHYIVSVLRLLCRSTYQICPEYSETKRFVDFILQILCIILNFFCRYSIKLSCFIYLLQPSHFNPNSYLTLNLTFINNQDTKTVLTYILLLGLVFGATALATASVNFVSYPTKASRQYRLICFGLLSFLATFPVNFGYLQTRNLGDMFGLCAV